MVGPPCVGVVTLRWFLVYWLDLSTREMWLSLPGDVALSCNPSYWEARTVGWLEVERPPLPASDGFWTALWLLI
jgi:hypothetical protein